MSQKDQPLSLAERIYKARGADLLSYLRRRSRNDADARDIAQETFLRFLRLQDTDRLRSPEAYLFRIAAGLLWERRRPERAEAAHAPLPETPTTEHTPFDLAAAAEESTRLKATVESLPLMKRNILILHLRDNLTFAQIAAQSGITVSLAKKNYYRALTECRDQLMDVQIDHGAAHD